MRYFSIFEDYELEASIARKTGSIDDRDRSVEPHYVVEVPEDAPWPHFMTWEGALVVSGAFLRALESAEVARIEAEAVRVVDSRTGLPREGYFELDVPDIPKVADLERSTFDVIMEGTDDGTVPPVLAFTTPVIDAGSVDGTKMFRLLEDSTIRIIDETVRDALVAHRPPEGWGVILEEVETG